MIFAGNLLSLNAHTQIHTDGPTVTYGIRILWIYQCANSTIHLSNGTAAQGVQIQNRKLLSINFPFVCTLHTSYWRSTVEQEESERVSWKNYAIFERANFMAKNIRCNVWQCAMCMAVPMIVHSIRFDVWYCVVHNSSEPKLPYFMICNLHTKKIRPAARLLRTFTRVIRRNFEGSFGSFLRVLKITKNGTRFHFSHFRATS